MNNVFNSPPSRTAHGFPGTSPADTARRNKRSQNRSRDASQTRIRRPGSEGEIGQTFLQSNHESEYHFGNLTTGWRRSEDNTRESLGSFDRRTDQESSWGANARQRVEKSPYDMAAENRNRSDEFVTSWIESNTGVNDLNQRGRNYQARTGFDSASYDVRDSRRSGSRTWSTAMEDIRNEVETLDKPVAGIWRPLKDSRHFFRLFTISGTTSDGEPRIELSEYSLSTHPKYYALSYTWGDEGGSLLELVAGLRDLPIRPNLYEFLKIITKRIEYGKFGYCHVVDNQNGSSDFRDNSIYFWADALCIDQNSLDEKARQVEQISRIFTQAEEVIVWLGRHNDGEPGCIKEVIRDSSVKFVSRSKLRFNKHIYWTRQWIVQEFVVPSNILIIDEDGEIRPEDLDPSLVLRGNFQRVMRLRQNQQQGLRKVNDISSVLKQCQGQDCSDPRDRVYSILSLFKNRYQSIPVSYNISVGFLCWTVLAAEKFRGEYLLQRIWHIIDGLELGHEHLQPYAVVKSFQYYICPMQVSEVEWKHIQRHEIKLDRGGILETKVEAIGPQPYLEDRRTHTWNRQRIHATRLSVRQEDLLDADGLRVDYEELYELRCGEVREGDGIFEFIGDRIALIIWEDHAITSTTFFLFTVVGIATRVRDANMISTAVSDPLLKAWNEENQKSIELKTNSHGELIMSPSSLLAILRLNYILDSYYGYADE